MKRLLSILMAMTLVLSCIVPVTYAETDKGGYAAVVAAVANQEDGSVKIFFDDYEPELSAAAVSLYPNDSLYSYKVTKNGQTATIADIKAGDALNFYYDTDYSIKEVSKLEIAISDKTISGKVDSFDYVSSCVINGVTYEVVLGTWSFKTNEWYTVLLDSRGRIVNEQIDYSKKTYGIIEKVYLDESENVYKAGIIKDNGSYTEFVCTDNDFGYGLVQKMSYKTKMSERLAEYKLDDSGCIFAAEFINAIQMTGVYSTQSNQIAGAKLSSDTRIIDLTDIYGRESYDTSDIHPYSVDFLQDNGEYTVLYGGVDNNGMNIFVAILEKPVDPYADITVTTAEITDTGVVFKVSDNSNVSAKQLYIAAYAKDRLLEIKTAEIANSVIEFNNSVTADTVKIFVLGSSLEPLSLAAEETVEGISEITITAEGVSGLLSALRLGGDEKAIYTIDGTDYTYVNDAAGAYSMEIGNEYVIYPDENNSIVWFEEATEFKRYGIIDKVLVDDYGDVNIRIIKTDGTIQSYPIKDKLIDTVGELVYSDYDAATSLGAMGSKLNAYENRAAAYVYNTDGEVVKIEQIAMTAAEDVYDLTLAQIGNAKLNAGTAVLDLSADGIDWNDIFAYSYSDIGAGSVESFLNGDRYGILYGDVNEEGYAAFVIITDGVPFVPAVNGIAVIESVKSDVSGTCIEIYRQDGSTFSYYVADSEDCEECLTWNQGDVIVYSLTYGGGMESISRIFSPIGTASNDSVGISYADAYAFWSNADFDWTDNSIAYMPNYMFHKSAIDAWDSSTWQTEGGSVRVGFGAVLNKSGNKVTFAKFGSDHITDDYSSEVAELWVADDANVYVYDFSATDGGSSNRVTVGAIGSIQKTFVPSSQLTQNDNGYDVYDWNTITSVDNANYAFYKMTNGEITDIMVILPCVG